LRIRAATSAGAGGLDADAVGPPPKEPREAWNAMIGANEPDERAHREPVLAELAEGLEHELAHHTHRAPVAGVEADAQHLGLGAGLVPRAAAQPRLEERPREIAHGVGARRPRVAERARVPKADRAGERDEHRDVRRVPSEARGELLDERLGRADRRAHLGPRLACGEGEPHGEGARVLRESSAPRRVIAIDDEALHVASTFLTLFVRRGPYDARDLGRYDVPVRVDRDEESAALEGEPDASARLGGALRRTQAERLPLELQELVGLDLATLGDHALEDPSFGRGELVDLLGQARIGSEHLPRGLERERDRRRRGAPEVVCGDRARALERGLGEERAQTSRVLALPRPNLHEVRDRQDELDRAAFSTSEHDASCREGLERAGHGRHPEHAVGFRDAVEKLDARRREPARIAEVRQLDERTRHLRGHVEALRGIDADPEARDERIELGLGQRAEDVGQAERGGVLRVHRQKSLASVHGNPTENRDLRGIGARFSFGYP
jgi:hypothetical protein